MLRNPRKPTRLGLPHRRRTPRPPPVGATNIASEDGEEEEDDEEEELDNDSDADEETESDAEDNNDDDDDDFDDWKDF